MPVRPPTRKELTDPHKAYKYAAHVLYDRFPAGEAIIASDPQAAYWYALDIVEGRWPEGEAAIATDSDLAERYARRALKGRFRAGEPAIASESGDLRLYKRMLSEEDPEGYAEFQLEYGDWAPDKVAEAALALARN